SIRDLNPSASSARCSSSHAARPPPASILRPAESPPSPTWSSRSHRLAFHWRSSSDRSHHREFVGVEDFLGGEFPGKFGDLIKAFVAQCLAEDVFEARTGVRLAIASRGGRPKPSYSEGKAKSSADW